MNKEIIDCIKAEKEKEAAAKKEKEEKIQKIKDFFKDLPRGKYRIATTIPVEEKVREHWYSKPYTYTNYKRKEPWLFQYDDHVTIDITGDNIIIAEGVGAHDLDISRWDHDMVETFYKHLDWFEQELGKEYCRKA